LELSVQTGVKRTLVCLLLALILGSCAAGSVKGDTVSGVSGRVLIGPQCPVEQVGSPCPDKPVAAEVRVFATGSQDVIATTRSDENGRFEIDLEPGSYDLLPVVSQSGELPSGARVPVAVHTGRHTRVTLTLDSGIR
jgi:hypothetical protein